VILIGGHPGIGKSTLILQTALKYVGTVLYVSGEESEEQIKLRAQRIAHTNTECYLYTETNISEVLTNAQKLGPQLLVIDSIQTMASSYVDSPPGSISQIKECTGELQRYAKETGVPVIIIGHITKDGSIAGPKLLEHIVDVVLQFEGDQSNVFRVLRTIKNRFGSTNELGIYSMTAAGLEEVANPSERLIQVGDLELSGD
jgi:DNA repair protein RadA/Sms